MKIKSINIKNIGIIADETITFDKPLILFYGEIRQGKSTILNAVRYAFGGSFPSDIIRHGQVEAHVKIEFDNGHLLREFYRAQSGETLGRALVLVLDGEKVKKPVIALEKFLNPFLLDQDHIIRMNERERALFFSELFNVDTKALDKAAAECEAVAKEIRATVRGYGDIDLTPCEAVSESHLRDKLAEVRTAHEAEVAKVTAYNKAIVERNENVKTATEAQAEWAKSIADLKAKLVEATRQESKISDWIRGNREQLQIMGPVAPDTRALEEQLQQVGVTNFKAKLYQANLARDAKRKEEQRRVSELEARQREIRDQKIANLAKLSAECGVPKLKFEENGSFTFEDTQAGMLSTSQLMKLSTLLSSLYPEGLGLDLIDRGESLGKSIFEHIERAKKENKTILAAIVGERPATVPENVGVFVVENGKVRA